MTLDSAHGLDDIADTAEDLAALRDSADDVLHRSWSLAAFRDMLAGPVFEPGLWRTVADLGWPDVLVTENRGGGGGVLRELCVLAEASGAAAAPIPLAGVAAAAWCADRCVDGVVLLLPTLGERTGVGVSGVWPVVPYGAVAGALVVCAGAGDQAVLGLVDINGVGVKIEPLTPLDHNPAARISLHEAPIDVLAEGRHAESRHRGAVLRAQIAQVSELVGIAAAANDTATEYAKIRRAFGRPIGAYQAIKHRLVDQRCAIEIGRALVSRAADACQDDHPDAAALTSLAAFWGIDALRAVAEGATQVFGGIAFTWEHDAHVHLRRAATSAALLGSRAYHRQAVTRWLGAGNRLTREGTAGA